MLEVQKKWWLPNLASLGWYVSVYLEFVVGEADGGCVRRHIAFWNLIGALGFTLCGALGYASLSSTKARVYLPFLFILRPRLMRVAHI